MIGVGSYNLINFAANHQDRPLAREIINDIKKSRPEDIADAKQENIRIKSTKTDNSNSKTTRLFKSKQERYFFEAVRRAFPTYHPYPNVAISCIIDFDSIKHELTKEERAFFFQGVVDSVVFDPDKDYEPLYFIELDSSYHDSENAIKRDKLKDSIFKIANIKLIRIRMSAGQQASIDVFYKLVIEIMRSL